MITICYHLCIICIISTIISIMIIIISSSSSSSSSMISSSSSSSVLNLIIMIRSQELAAESELPPGRPGERVGPTAATSELREMGGAPRNPAPRNHCLAWIVKPPGCHCTDALGGNKYRRVPTPLGSTSPFSDECRQETHQGEQGGAANAQCQSSGGLSPKRRFQSHASHTFRQHCFLTDSLYPPSLHPAFVFSRSRSLQPRWPWGPASPWAPGRTRCSWLRSLPRPGDVCLNNTCVDKAIHVCM